jgi:hypothetical protein
MVRFRSHRGALLLRHGIRLPSHRSRNRKRANGRKQNVKQRVPRRTISTRVLIIVLGNADYERAIQDPSLRDPAIEGASLTNFHALFHPSYPNYWRGLPEQILACTAAAAFWATAKSILRTIPPTGPSPTA